MHWLGRASYFPTLWTKGDFLPTAIFQKSCFLMTELPFFFFFKGACGSSRPAVVSLLNYRGSDYRAQVCFVVTFHRSDCAPVSGNAYSWGRQEKSSGITVNRSELALRCERRHIERWKWLRGLCHFQSSKSKRVNSLYEKGEKKKSSLFPSKLCWCNLSSPTSGSPRGGWASTTEPNSCPGDILHLIPAGSA